MNTTPSSFAVGASHSIKATRKPVTFLVWQYQGESTLEHAPKWVQDYELKSEQPMLGIKNRIEVSRIPETAANCSVLLIPTLEGSLRASAGDWLIQGVNKEIWACKPDIFEKTYSLHGSSTEQSLKIPVSYKEWWEETGLRAIYNRDTTFKGIDLNEVSRDLRHGILDRRTLLAEAVKLRNLLDESAEATKALLEQRGALQRALALWLPEDKLKNPQLEALRCEHAKLLEGFSDTKSPLAKAVKEGYSSAFFETVPAGPHNLPEASPEDTERSIASCEEQEFGFDKIASLLKQASEALQTLHHENSLKTARIEALEAICAASYQMAGVYDAPVRFLDALGLHDEYFELSAEEIIDKLLPVDCPSQEL